jgi:hypothetical protein
MLSRKFGYSNPSNNALVMISMTQIVELKKLDFTDQNIEFSETLFAIK